jgi:uroporphyrinogen decarboxylase
VTPYDRLMSALSGKQPDRVPVVPWVRDWCALQAGFGIVDIIENVEKHVYSQFYSRQKFGYDCVWDLCGVSAESEAMGTVIRYDNETPPMAVDHPVKDYNRDLKNLQIPDPHRDGRMPNVIKGVERLKELCQGSIPVIGYVQGPLRHATMLRSTEALMRDMLKNPEPVKELLSIVVDSLMVYGAALVHAGADVLMIGDPASSGDVISRKHWEKWGLEPTVRLVQFLKGTGVKVILHICGNITDRLDIMPQIGLDALSVDEKVDLKTARTVLGPDFCLFGNVSPSKALFFGPAEVVESESHECIEKAGRDGPFILGSGCVVPEITDAQHIAAMVHAAEIYGVY